MIETNTKIIYTADDESPWCNGCDNYTGVTCSCDSFCKEENRWCYYHRTINKVET